LLFRIQKLRGIHLLALACIASAQIALADSGDPTLASPRACELSNPSEASSLADRLFEKGEYQHAGVCYQAAGDMVHANLAFLKAAAPQSEDTARALKSQRDAAKALFAKVGNTFHGGH
jgi:hypothetical protein